ncbi:GAF and ANTAR domain-containing protein [Pseudonocardia pini]|uniref:GAF and ANTAR domain-containing protein n=1 Tax=Pseudonocardia pini TaxID=2758030 RepID=UPI0015F1088B|nr:GAF and ANTAR domain-containing protein [Pseudonocardia pini]
MADDRDETLAEEFADIARLLQAETGVLSTQERVTRVATKTVRGCDHAAISLIGRNGVVRTVGATDDVPARVDRLQYELGEGPCVDAIRTHEVYLTGDLATEVRWPRFASRAVAETGVRSMLALRLFAQEDTFGALNLYSRSTDAFDPHARAVAAILAAHAAVAMRAAQQRDQAEHLGAALESNRRIGMAMGVLMARGQLSEDAAFALLRRASQHLNVKLRDIADTIVETGEAPELP